MTGIKKFFKSVFKPDVFVTFLNYGLKIVLYPIVLIFVPLFLDEKVQGYWFTFQSVAALTTLADMGFTSIITLFAAHEYAFLSYDRKSAAFKGDEKYFYRLSSLFSFLMIWALFVAIAATVIVFLAGFVLFSSKKDGVIWLTPWAIYVIGTVINFSSQLFLSFFEGCNQFLITQRIRIISSVTQSLISIIMLFRGFGLYSIGISMLAGAMVAVVSLLLSFGPAAKQMLKHRNAVKVSWMKEILPLLGKYAVSFISGSISSQIYNPLAFSLGGSEVAGRVGYGLSIAQGIRSVANVWNTIAVPHYNAQVEKREWKGMDRQLKQNIIYTETTFSIGMIAVLILGNISFLRGVIWARTLPIASVIPLLAANALSLIVACLAVYLRAHKQEPLMRYSLVSGVLSALLTFVCAKFFGVEFIFCGDLFTMAAMFPWSLIIFRNCRRTWHRCECE